MLVWINGPFGGGKSSVTESLRRLAEKLIVYDPEEAGFYLREWVPLPESNDFQDLACWREIVAKTCGTILRHYPEHLLAVPMTLVNESYREDILGSIRKNGGQVLHVWLSVSREALVQRIVDQVVWPDDPVRDAEVRGWRLAQVDRAISCERNLGEETVLLPVRDSSPDNLAEKILFEINRFRTWT